MRFPWYVYFRQEVSIQDKTRNDIFYAIFEYNYNQAAIKFSTLGGLNRRTRGQPRHELNAFNRLLIL